MYEIEPLDLFTRLTIIYSYVTGFKAGIPGNLKVKCGSPSETTVTTIVSSTPIITSSIEPSTSVAINNKTTDATRSSNTGKISFDSLLMESTRDDPDMICNYAVEHSYYKIFVRMYTM